MNLSFVKKRIIILLSVILAVSQYAFVVSSSESEEPAAISGEYAGLPIMNFAASSGSNPAKLVADNHAIMLRSDGRFMVWGDNTYGQLGLGAGAPTKVYVPTENTFFSDNELTVKDVVVVEDATFVLCRNGELYTFGKGLNGRLGNGGTANVSTPTLITGSQSIRFQKLYPGKEFIVAHTDDNKLYAWGRNSKGQIGNGTKTDVLTPVKIMDNADVQYLTVGDDYVLLVKQDNTLWCWGNNENGQFPFDGTYKVGTVSTSMSYTSNIVISRVTPANPFAIKNPPASNSTKTYSLPSENITPSKIGTSPLIFSRTTYQLTAQTLLFAVYLPNGTSNKDNWDVPPSNFSGGAGTISNFVVSYSTVAKWNGDNGYGDTGTVTATTTWSESPANINFANTSHVSKISNIQAGSRHGYLLHNGKFYSFGDNTLKQQSNNGIANGILSTATIVNSFITSLDNSGGGFSSLIVAKDTNYILSGAGKAYAWGGNNSGKAGTGSAASYIAEPTEIIGDLDGTPIAKIVPGRNTTYFLSHSGDVFVTGDNLYGQTGLGDDYIDEIKITEPTKIEIFKFAEDMLPPDTPDSVNTPDEVEAGTVIEIQWTTVSNATEYELVRYATPKNDTIQLISAVSDNAAEVIYTGDQPEFTDIAAEEWDNVSYGLRAVNFIGDKSQEAMSGAINVIEPTSGGNNGGDGDNDGGDDNNGGNNNNNNGNLTDDQLQQILDSLKNSGLSNEQLQLLLESMSNNNHGLTDKQLASILSSNRRRNGDVVVTVPDSYLPDTDELLSYLEDIVSGEAPVDPFASGTYPSDAAFYANMPNTGGLPIIIFSVLGIAAVTIGIFIRKRQRRQTDN